MVSKMIYFGGTYYELLRIDYNRQTVLFKEVDPEEVQFIVPSEEEPGTYRYEPKEPWLRAYHKRQKK